MEWKPPAAVSSLLFSHQGPKIDLVRNQSLYLGLHNANCIVSAPTLFPTPAVTPSPCRSLPAHGNGLLAVHYPPHEPPVRAIPRGPGHRWVLPGNSRGPIATGLLARRRIGPLALGFLLQPLASTSTEPHAIVFYQIITWVSKEQSGCTSVGTAGQSPVRVLRPDILPDQVVRDLRVFRLCLMCSPARVLHPTSRKHRTGVQPAR